MPERRATASFGQFVAGLNHGVLAFIAEQGRDPDDDELRGLGERVLEACARSEGVLVSDTETPR